jgi:hypothetical protein
MSAQPTETDRDARRAGAALARIMAGDEAEGLALYRESLKAQPDPPFPAGHHLLFLERAGRTEAAAALRDLVLRRGGSVALSDAAPGSTPEKAARELEALFAQGLGNSKMVTQYLAALARLDRPRTVAGILDPGRLLRLVRLDDAVAPAAVAEALLREIDRASHRDAEKSVRLMRKLDGVHRHPDPTIRALVSALRAESCRYLADWAGSDHPLAQLVPRSCRIKAWSLFSQGEGYNVPHIHHKGWATGVYYPCDPSGGGPGGELQVGPPPGAPEDSGWPNVAIRPEAGLLVLMPSFYTHWTVPLGRPGLRISVAFDLLDTRRARGPARLDAPIRIR